MKNMVNRLTPTIQYLSIPQEVIDCLVRTRTFIRMNNLNKQLISDKYQYKEKRILQGCVFCFRLL